MLEPTPAQCPERWPDDELPQIAGGIMAEVDK